MSDWNKLLDDVQAHLDKLAASGCDMPFFRGHEDTKWHLLCGLSRLAYSDAKVQDLENIIYYDFVSLGGGLLGKQADSWKVLFTMQHHGLPTRLLDWSTTFAAALYFALRRYVSFPDLSIITSLPCVWILDPFELNRIGQDYPAIMSPYTDFDTTYHEYLVEESMSFGADVLAISPPQQMPRQSAQRSVFTLHADLSRPLNAIAAGATKKFEIPIDCIEPAIRFLKLAGINEFSVFPDLDGLARHLKKEHSL